MPIREGTPRLTVLATVGGIAIGLVSGNLFSPAPVDSSNHTVNRLSLAAGPTTIEYPHPHVRLSGKYHSAPRGYPARGFPDLGEIDSSLLTNRLATLQMVGPAGGRNLFQFVPMPPRNRVSVPVRNGESLPTHLDHVANPQQKPQTTEVPPLIYYGYVSRDGRRLRGFFFDGEAIHIKAEGDAIGMYKVIHIGANFAVLETKAEQDRLILHLADAANL